MLVFLITNLRNYTGGLICRVNAQKGLVKSKIGLNYSCALFVTFAKNYIFTMVIFSRLLFLLTLLILIIVGCDLKNNPPSNEVIRERLLSGEFEAYEYLPSIPCDTLDIDSLGNHFNKDSLYSGICFEYFENSLKKRRIQQIFKGKLHGNSLLLGTDGDTISMQLYSHGKFVRELKSLREKVLCDSLELFQNDLGRQVYFHNGSPFTGNCVVYFLNDTTKIQQQKSFLNGVLEGEWTDYDSLGNVINNTEYIDGNKIES